MIARRIALPVSVISALALFLVLNLAASAKPVISEFLASNSGESLVDEDGEPSDWIELHNDGAEPVNLGGYRLTDDLAAPDKWVLPAVAVEPGAYMIVFASGKDRSVAGEELHTNFGLNASGEYLALIDPAGVAVTEFNGFPEQSEDVSYGIGLSGGSEVVNLVETGADASWHVPSAEVNGWRLPGFADASWTKAKTGIGFDYPELVGEGGDCQAAMQGNNASIFIRVPFQVANPAAVQGITLRMKFEDGFAAFINGQEVAFANQPENLAWDSAATDSNTDSDAVVFEDFPLDTFGNLRPGENILAIHGLNSSKGGSDALFLPELEAVVLSSSEQGLGYFLTPTPGAPNSSRVDGFVSDTKFEPNRGYFDEPFNLEITTTTENATIRFTTDGSAPTAENGIDYTGPIPIATTTCVRAAAFKPGFEPANIDTHTYLFLNDVANQPDEPEGFPTRWGSTPADYEMDPDITHAAAYAPRMRESLRSLPAVSIVSNLDDLFETRNGIYANPERKGVAWEKPVSFEWINPDGSSELQANCGLRIQGGYFRQASVTQKHSLRFLFKREYGPGKLRHDLFKEPGATEEFDTLVLRAGANDGYAWNAARDTEQFIRDEFGRRLMLNMGHPNPRGLFVHVYLNGLYWGLFNLCERPNEDFSTTYYGGVPEDWLAVNWRGVKNGDLDPWNQLTRDARNVNTIADYEKLQGNDPDGTRDPEYPVLLDSVNYIDYMIVNLWGGNWDWPNKNFWYGRDGSENSTGFKFYIWDFENTMGNNRDRSPLTMKAPRNTDGVGQPHGRLRRFSEYQMDFADRVQKWFFNGGVLTREPLKALYKGLADGVEAGMISETARWGDDNLSQPQDLADWLRERDWILDTYLERRSEIVLDQFRRDGLYPDVEAPLFNQYGGEVPADFSVAFENASSTQIYYTLDGSDPRRAVDESVATEGVTLVAEDAAVEVYFPLSADDGFIEAGKSWTDPEFEAPDSWTRGTGGVGFDSGDPAEGFNPLIELDVSELMKTKSASALIRVPFQMTAAQIEATQVLDLNIRYDDGFAAYINGQKIAEANAPATLDGRSNATGSHADADAERLERFNAGAGIAALRPGTNILAIQGLNTTAGGSDFLISAQLTGSENQSLSPSAVAYSEPFILPRTTLVRARALDGETWSALEEALFIVGAVPPSAENLVVSEFMYQPGAPSEAEKAAGFDLRSDFEFLEVLNIGAGLVNLSGVRLTQAVFFEFPAGIILEPGARILVVEDVAAMKFRYGNGVGQTIAGQWNGKLNDSGETITLLNPGGDILQSFTYSEEDPWPKAADGGGPSVVLVGPETAPDHKMPANWTASAVSGGTPGRGEGEPEEADFLSFALGADLAGAPTGSLYYIATGDDGSLVFAYRRRADAPGINYAVEESPDLRNWTPVAPGNPEETEHGDGTRTVRVALSNGLIPGAAARFFRLTVARE